MKALKIKTKTPSLPSYASIEDDEPFYLSQSIMGEVQRKLVGFQDKDENSVEEAGY